MSKSNIEWTGFTWNPIVGCSVTSPGCTNCYAMKMARRIELMGTAPHYAGLTQQSKAGAVWTGKLAKAPRETLLEPLRRKKPTTWFVNSMSDLFHEAVPDDWIDEIFAVMALCRRHVFQVLTKRSKRMREYCSTIQKSCRWLAMEEVALQMGYDPRGLDNDGFDWLALNQFLPNLWLGVSTEDQARADERIPDLLATPATVRFISAEPLLGPIRLHEQIGDDWLASGLSGERKGLDWVIVGGESGPGARPMDLDWARAIVAQCRGAGVPCFVKQLGSATGLNLHDRKGGDPSEWPADLRVREMP